ncbi:MAG: substrate-binding domain-containing protein [Firmicutes bacterium]|nr:substrate-binding domain-containing protein [Bacillota bacterium]
MLKNQKLVAISLILLFVLTMSLFSPISYAAKGKYRISVALCTLNVPFFVEMKKGLEEEAAKQGVQLYIADANNSPGTQLAQVEDMITQKFDLIILNPADAKALIPAARALNKSGIPWITLDRFVDEKGYILHVGASAEMGGYFGGKALVKALNGKGRVIVLEGIPGSSASRDRSKGFTSVISNYPGIKIIAQQPADFSRQKAMEVMENLLQAHRDIDAVYAYNDEMALGAINAIEAAGRKGIIVIGCDAEDEAIEAVKKGRMYATVDFAPRKTGRDAVRVAVQLLEGQEVQGVYFSQGKNWVPWVMTVADIVDAQSLKK